MKWVLCFLLIFINSAQAVLTVGNDVQCDHASIEAAFNSADDSDHEIRVTNQQVHTDVFTINKPVIIKGGYANCNDAVNDVLDVNMDDTVNRTHWSGEGLRTVIHIHTDDEFIPASLYLTNFRIKDGFNTAEGETGGIKVTGYSSLYLDQVSLVDNEGDYGGAIHVAGVHAYLNINSTNIINNRAGLGGGIYCIARIGQPNASVHELNDSWVYNNRASTGGGLYLSNNCQFKSTSGSMETSGFPTKGIVSNHADDGYGGGVRVYNAHFILESFNGYTPAVVSHNSSRVGGGIDVELGRFTANKFIISDNYAVDLGGGISSYESIIDIRDGILKNNQSATSGGAIYIYSGEVANMTRIDFVGNSAERGGAIYSSSSSETYVNQSVFSGNTALYGEWLVVDGDPNYPVDFTIRSSMIQGHTNEAGQAGRSLVRLVNYSTLNIIQSTFVDNKADGFFEVMGEQNHVLLENSVLADTEVEQLFININSNEIDVNINYSAMYPDNSLDEIGAQLNQNLVLNSIEDMGFVNHESGDLSLRSNSPLVDYAPRPSFYDDNPDLVLRDLNNYVFGYDYEDEPNVHGSYDIGALEYVDDVIFADGFE